MTPFDELSDAALQALHCQAADQHASFKSRGLNFNMARGKPSPEQLDLVEQLLEFPGRDNYLSSDGTDCRNYGGERGLPEARALLSTLVGASPENTLVEGNSSLAIMHDHLVFSLLKGNPDSSIPWGQQEKIRFLCPVPGYDYHFNMTEEYGIEMIPVALHDDGPDMDEVEALVAKDASIKGIWCVPKYSNPTGIVYSDAVIDRLAYMPTAAPDFRLFWDNAYAIHHLTEERITIANVLKLCAEAGHPNRALVFASTSKVTFPGEASPPSPVPLPICNGSSRKRENVPSYRTASTSFDTWPCYPMWKHYMPSWMPIAKSSCPNSMQYMRFSSVGAMTYT